MNKSEEQRFEKALERRSLVKTKIIPFISSKGIRYGKGVSIAKKKIRLGDLNGDKEKQKIKALVPEDIKEKVDRIREKYAEMTPEEVEPVKKMRAKHQKIKYPIFSAKE